MIGDTIRINLAEKYALDPDDVQELYEAAQESFTEGMQELVGAIDASDFEQVRRGAHTFKGTLANMGLMDLSAVALEMEQAAAQKNITGAGQALARLQKDLGPLLLD